VIGIGGLKWARRRKKALRHKKFKGTIVPALQRGERGNLRRRHDAGHGFRYLRLFERKPSSWM